MKKKGRAELERIKVQKFFVARLAVSLPLPVDDSMISVHVRYYAIHEKGHQKDHLCRKKLFGGVRRIVYGTPDDGIFQRVYPQVWYRSNLGSC